MSNKVSATANAEENSLIQKLQSQIERIGLRKERRLARIERINSKLTSKREMIATSEDSTSTVSTKYEAKNLRDIESFDKGLARRNTRLSKFEKRLIDLTTRIENYRTAVQDWTNKKLESNRVRSEKRALALKNVSVEGILEYIEKRELYLEILEKRNSQADALVIEKQNFIEKVKADLLKPKPTIKLVKVEPEPEVEIEEEEIEEVIEVTVEPVVETKKVDEPKKQVVKPTSTAKPKQPVKPTAKPQIKKK